MSKKTAYERLCWDLDSSILESILEGLVEDPKKPIKVTWKNHIKGETETYYTSLRDYLRERIENTNHLPTSEWVDSYGKLFYNPLDSTRYSLCGIELPGFEDRSGFYQFCYSDKPLPTNITELLAELRMEMPKEKEEELKEIEKNITPTEKFFYWLARDKKANYFYIFDFVKIIPLLIFFAVMSAILFNGGWIITMIIGLYIIYGYIHKAASETYGKL